MPFGLFLTMLEKISRTEKRGHYAYLRCRRFWRGDPSAPEITALHVAEATGLSVSFISDVERGKPTAELGKVLSLANLLGLDCEMKARGE